MKTPLTQNPVVKVFAWLLALLLLTGTALSAVIIGFAWNYDCYQTDASEFSATNLCRGHFLDRIHDMEYALQDGLTPSDILQWMNASQTNLRFAVFDADGSCFFYNDDAVRDAYTAKQFDPSANDTVSDLFIYDINRRTYAVRLQDPLSVHDVFYEDAQIFGFLFRLKWIAVWAAIAGFIFGLLDLIFLCCAAGHRRGQDKPMLNFFDRIPLDLWLCTATVCGGFALAGIIDLVESRNALCYTLALLCLFGFMALVLSTLLTFCTRIKVGRWWRNTLIWKLIRMVFLILQAIFRWFLAVVSAIPALWKIVVCCVGLLLLSTLMAFQCAPREDIWVAYIWVVGGGVSLFLCWTVWQLQKLKKAGQALVSGDFNSKTRTDWMLPEIKEHGENLNSLANGLSVALEQRMRSERLKTELITNVSHDIKTPLTSIINYVDLLQKEHTEEQGQEYLAVLDRQAKRLKKLTEDLLEASKASTGNISAALAPCNLHEFLNQILGEYEGRLSDAGLTLVTKVTGEELSVMADGKLLWRILDNLLGNTCKYALSGTRVYLDVYPQDSDAVIAVKNISSEPLNISADELMERFVRGDSSRSTEGSGLGLSIARSLTELQHGSFRLEVDGDLFKATITLPRISKEDDTHGT